MSSHGHFTLPVPFLYKQSPPYTPAGLNNTRGQAPLVPAAARNVGNPSFVYTQSSYAPARLNQAPQHMTAANVGNVLPNPEIKSYPCRHCERVFTTAEGMAGHTNVHARRVMQGTLGKRKAETHLPGPYNFQINNSVSHPINRRCLVTQVYPNVAPALGVGPNFNTTKPYLNIPPQAPYPTNSLIPYGNMTAATSFPGQQLWSQFKKPAIHNAKRLNGGIHPANKNDLDVQDFIGSLASKATPNGTSIVVIEGENHSSDLDLELKL